MFAAGPSVSPIPAEANTCERCRRLASSATVVLATAQDPGRRRSMRALSDDDLDHVITEAEALGAA
jgi:hypothetical protein